MIVADTNILGTFARVDRLELLFDLFSQDEIGVAPAVGRTTHFAKGL